MKAKPLFAIKQPVVKEESAQIKDSDTQISALIKKRRRQILVHSFIQQYTMKSLILAQDER